MAERAPHPDGVQPLPADAPDATHIPDAHETPPPAVPETFELDVDSLGLTAEDRAILSLDMGPQEDFDVSNFEDVFMWGTWG